MSQAWNEYWDELSDLLARHFLKKVVIFSPHAISRMKEREISLQSIQFVTERNTANEMFAPHRYPHGEKPYANPDPVFSITGYDQDGKMLTIAVAVLKLSGALRFKIVTVFDTAEISRHNNK